MSRTAANNGKARSHVTSRNKMQQTKKLTRRQRRSVQNRVVTAQRMMPAFERELLRKRTEEITRVLNALKGYSPDRMPELAAEMLNESYLPGLYRRLYLGVGSAIAEMVATDTVSSKADSSRWEFRLNEFVENYSGDKIVLVSGTLKEFVRKQIQLALLEMPEKGIEAQTQFIYERVLNHWDSVKKWQVRRIVQTEAMEAMMVGQYESMRELGIAYQKVWTATFNNTRPQHIAMDGVAVGQDEFFILPNGDRMMYPHDSVHGARAENLINCACGTFDLPI